MTRLRESKIDTNTSKVKGFERLKYAASRRGRRDLEVTELWRLTRLSRQPGVVGLTLSTPLSCNLSESSEAELQPCYCIASKLRFSWSTRASCLPS
jgi:hypothetical protein